MDLKTGLVSFKVILGTDEKQPHFMHNRGFGKRSLECEEEDAPDMTVKRRLFWNISKLVKKLLTI